MTIRYKEGFLGVALLSWATTLCSAQSAPPSPIVPETPAAQRSIEDLNLTGADVAFPQFSDTVLGVESGFREALYSKGMLLRIDFSQSVTVNLLDGPVPAGQQVYIGQRPTSIGHMNPIFTADLRQLHLQGAQFNIGFAWRWTNWNPAGPRTAAISTLYFYKMWRDRRVEMKAGYIVNNNEFVGMQVGGSIATAAQGVYAVLPYETGMSFYPLTSPTLNVRVRGPLSTYFKIGVQRSLDAAGAPADEARNQSGMRFAPNGDKLLLINEAGYLRASSPAAHYTWFRAGYLHNDSPYTNKATGQKEAGNYAAYALMDYQIHRSAYGAAAHGLYVGATAMVAPAKFDIYDRYYEARVYQKAPVRQRPADVLSLVAAYQGRSKYVTSSLAAQGQTVWHNSPSITGTYAMHVSRGNFLSLGLGYVRGAATTPRVHDALTLTLQWGIYL
jgi:porin